MNTAFMQFFLSVTQNENRPIGLFSFCRIPVSFFIYPCSVIRIEQF
jgi:hypothetical protein